jgi:N-acetylglucosamine-6-sulfatase
MLGLAGLVRGQTRPNIVFIITDDHRWDCLSRAGHAFLKTPNIDRIANEGAYFENAFVTLPLCSPSRASVLTGQYANKHAIVGNTAAGGPISHQLDTWPRRLQKSGYETACVGKWHMGVDDSPRPGFDRWVVFKGQGRYENPVFNIDGTQTKTTGYVTDLITDYAVEFIKQGRGDKPFAMYVGHKAVHSPFQPAPRHAQLFAEEPLPRYPGEKDDLKGKPAITRKVAEMEPGHPAYGVTHDLIRNQLRSIVSVDEGVGRILKALEETGQLDNTLVIFTSDNGFFWNEHRLGDKRAAYEESIRVPLVMRYPALIKAGSVIKPVVLNIDVAPTLIELAGASPIEGMHGRSLVSLLRGDDANWREAALFHYVLEEKYPNIPTWQAVRTDRWKYIHYPDHPGMDELYDLQTDPHELTNRIDDPAAAEDLVRLKRDLSMLLAAAK